MTNYQWDALLCEVARKVGWEEWDSDMFEKPVPVLDDSGTWMDTDDLNSIAALMERAGVECVNVRYRDDCNKSGKYWVALDLITKREYPTPGWPDAEMTGDTPAHALLLTLAAALGIDVETYKEEEKK